MSASVPLAERKAEKMGGGAGASPMSPLVHIQHGAMAAPHCGLFYLTMPYHIFSIFHHAISIECLSSSSRLLLCSPDKVPNGIKRPCGGGMCAMELRIRILPEGCISFCYLSERVLYK